MRLSTRLSLVVGALVTILSIAIGTFAIVDSENSEIRSITSMLNASTNETLKSHDDPFSVAITVSDTSPLPLSVALATDSSTLSYIAENSASIVRRPSRQDLLGALTSPVLVEKSFLIRTIKTSDNQYLIYSMSIANTQAHSRKLIGDLILFIACSLLISILTAYLLFRRDSKINSIARGLKENNEKMQAFLGDASHELRTPLTVISGYTDLMISQPNHSETPRFLATLKAEVGRMELLIKDLLFLAELGDRDGGDSSTENEIDLDLSSLLAKYLQELSDLNPERPIKSSLNQITIRGEEKMLETLFANIFSNIRRHTPSSAGVEISLTSSRNTALITIDDAGPGIPNLENRIFTRFDPSRSRESGGSGLGMSIMSGIVKRMDGQLELKKSSLGGLRIEITLPINKK